MIDQPEKLYTMPPYTRAVVMSDLNLMRCFSIARIPYVPIATTDSTLIFHSKGSLPGIRIPDPAVDAVTAKNRLIEAAKHWAEKSVLYYSNDQQLLMVSDYREEFRQHFHLLLPPSDFIREVVDKRGFVHFARQHRLPTPQTFLREELQQMDIEKDIVFPCVVKPTTRFLWKIKGQDPFQKVITVKDAAELRGVLATIPDDKDFVLQRYIEGTDDLVYSYHAFYDQDGKREAYFCGKKIRAYPNHNGYSASVGLVHDPELAALGHELMQRIGLVGVIKVDFKYDPQNRKYYLLELNPRFNMWHYLGAVCGINIPHLAYATLNGATLQGRETYRTDICWFNMHRDVLAGLESYRHGRLTLAGWLRSYQTRKIYDVFAWSDPKPALYGVLRFVFNRINDLIGKIRPAYP